MSSSYSPSPQTKQTISSFSSSSSSSSLCEISSLNLLKLLVWYFISNSISSGTRMSLLKLFVKMKSLVILERIWDSFFCSKYLIKCSNKVFIEEIFDVQDKFDIFILFLVSSRLIKFELELGVVLEVELTLIV